MPKPTIKPALLNYYLHANGKNLDHTPGPFDPANLTSSAGVTVSNLGVNLEGTSGADLIVSTGDQRQLFGFEGNDLIFGSPQDDRINGATGIDVMVGGQGNDIYLVDDSRDRIIERPGEGIDTVSTTVGYTLSDNVENLYVTTNYISDDQPLVGNALDNNIVGSTWGYATLLGMDGNDRLSAGVRAGSLLNGGNGDDILLQSVGECIGGAGADTFVAAGRGALSAPNVPITITDFNAAEGDRIVIYALQAYSSADLFASEALHFDAATSQLVLDLDPTTTETFSVDQIIYLTGVHTFDPAWVLVTDQPV